MPETHASNSPLSRFAEEDSFGVLFDAAPLPAAIIGTDGRFLRVNEGFRRLFRMSESDLVGSSYLDVTHPAERDRSARLAREVDEEARDQFQLERLFVKGNGDTFWGLASVSAHRRQGRAPDFFVAHVLDITERKRSEVLHESRNEVLEVVAGGAPLPEILHTLSLVVERAMPGGRVCILLADADGKHLHHAASPSMPDWFTTAVDGFPIAVDAGGCGTACARGVGGVTRNLPDDPNWAPHRERLVEEGLRCAWAEPIPGSDGRSLGTITLYFRSNRNPRSADYDFVDDATSIARMAVERARTVDALTASEEQYRKVFETTTDGLIILAPDGTVVDVNPAVCRMHGQTREQFLELSPSGFVHADSMHLFEEFQALLISGEEYRCEATDIRRDGTGFNIDVHGIPFRFRGQPHLLAILRDTTEARIASAKLAERSRDLESRNRDLEDFASITSHDLQEPLRKIRAFGDMLRAETGEDLSDRAGLYLKRILDSADWARTLVQDLRRYSRTASARAAREPVDLGVVLSAALSDLEIPIRETGAVVTTEEMPEIIGDPVQLRQLFLNLIGNAIKFSRDGVEPEIRITSVTLPRAAAGDPVRYRIRVEDNGIGFPSEYAQKIFGVFERLHGRDAYEGTGLGLAIVRKVVEQHAGSVRATSRPGEGTVFEVELPGG